MKRLCILTLILLSLFCAAASAETARELKPAKITATVNQASVSHLTDNAYKTVWFAKKGYVQVEMSEPAYGVYICHFKYAVRHVIQIPDGKGGYMDYIHHDEEYLHQYTPLPGVSSFRIAIQTSLRRIITPMPIRKSTEFCLRKHDKHSSWLTISSSRHLRSILSC